MFLVTLYKYILPSLLVGALGGYFVGNTLSRTSGASKAKSSTLRADFLSSADDEIDYDKMARVCLVAAGRAGPHTTARASIMAEPNSPEVLETKEKLDHVMSLSLEKGRWSRGAGAFAEGLLQRLPPSDVADFEQLLRATVERGDLTVQPGAWVPASLN